MKTLYIECKMGAAGDMLTAALLELLPEEKRIEALNVLQNIGLEGVEFSLEKMVKCGIQGTHVHVHINGQEEESIDAHHHHEDHHHDHEEHHHHHDEESHEHSHNHTFQGIYFMSYICTSLCQFIQGITRILQLFVFVVQLFFRFVKHLC